jgi:cyclopropane fatty-acyl-phospholipid synthase-like methyltransferase
MEYDNLNDEQKVQVAKGFDAIPELIPFIPFLLQDLFALGASPQIIIQILKSLDLKKDSTVLDLACGKGAVSIRMAKSLGFSCKGIDLFKPFVEFANKKAIEEGVENLCRFEVDDINTAVRVERNYDVVVLAAAETLLGEIDNAIKKLRNCIRRGGFIIYDGCYLNNESSLDNPDYSVIKNYDKTVKQLTSFGDKIINEVIIPVEDTINIDRMYTEAIRKRANDLAELQPDKKKLFFDYVKRQEEECSIIENDITSCVWCIRKTG